MIMPTMPLPRLLQMAKMCCTLVRIWILTLISSSKFLLHVIDSMRKRCFWQLFRPRRHR